jgi:uncharacterized MAPEG superfamily protein
MTIELTMLALAVVLGLVQIVIAAQAKSRQTGLQWTAGPRDEPKPLTGVAGRLDRALSNFLETFPLFVAAVLIAHATGRHDWMTKMGRAALFLGPCRLCALYAFGVTFVRTLAWTVATLGNVLILLSLAF